jgi:hypothetical protein
MTKNTNEIKSSFQSKGGAVTGIKVVRLLSASCIALFAFGLFFRAVLYSRMYIAPGDPYGISDIIEFLLGWLLIGFLGLSAITVIILGIKGPRSNRIAATWLAGIVTIIALLFAPLHTLAAKLSSW